MSVGQSRRASATEAALNIGSGFLVSMLVWQTIGPWFGYQVTLADNLGITAIFTVVSIVRTYVWRRAFNHFHTRRPAAWLMLSDSTPARPRCATF